MTDQTDPHHPSAQLAHGVTDTFAEQILLASARADDKHIFWLCLFSTLFGGMCAAIGAERAVAVILELTECIAGHDGGTPMVDEVEAMIEEARTRRAKPH